MHPVSSSIPTSLPLFARPETGRPTAANPGERPAGSGHTHHSLPAHDTRHADHGEDNGGSKARQIFRQEFMQAFRIEFRSEQRISAGATQAYRQAGSGDDIVGDTLADARSAIQTSESGPEQTLVRLRQTVSEAASITRQAVATRDGQQSTDSVEAQVNKGLDAIAGDQEFLAASALAVDAKLRQRSTLSIRTLEGDVVKLDVRRVDRLAASDVAIQAGDTSASLTELAVSSRSRLVLRVNGDLNAAELEAIRNVFAQAESLADQFFAGDVEAALKVSAGLQYDSGQLARVSLRFRSSERIQASQLGLQSAANPPAASDATAITPSSADVSAEKPTPVVAAAGPAVTGGDGNDNVVSSNDGDLSTDTGPPAGTGSNTGSPGLRALFGGPSSGLGSLASFIGMIADYLQQSTGQLNDTLRDGNDAVAIRFKIEESFRLDALNIVMADRVVGDKPGPGTIADGSIAGPAPS